MKYYKAKLYKKPNQKVKINKLKSEEFIGDIIIEDKTTEAVEVVTRLRFDIYDSSSTIRVDSKRLNKFSRDLYVKDSDIDYDNPVTSSELNSYIDFSATDGFCLNNEIMCINGIKKPYEKNKKEDI